MWHGPWLATLAMDAFEQIRFGVEASASTSPTQSMLQCSMHWWSNPNTSLSLALKRFPNGDLVSGDARSSGSGMWKDTRERGVGVRAMLCGFVGCRLKMLEGSCTAPEADFGVRAEGATAQAT